MSKAISNIPYPVNEPVKSYAPGSPEKKELKSVLAEMKSSVMDIPMVIGGEEIRTDKKIEIRPPHEHKHVLAHFHQGDETHVHQAINAALDAKKSWANLPWEQRVSVFLKAADLLTGPYRAKMNAATMLGQSKSVFQAEIDAACELIDFLNFNAYFMQEIYMEQPDSLPGMWNRTEYRPLEGFVAAITPFNFTSIGANLAAAPAMMGNTVLWKPSETQIYSAWVFMEIMKEAGLPDGVINIIYTDGPTTGDIVFKHRDLAGVHFTGSTKTFQHIWKTIGTNIDKFRTYPRIVGETGGKDFILAHRSADAKEVATAITRGAFEYQGQKCSAASRVYIDQSIWKDVEKFLLADLKNIKMGSPEDFRNFFNAVIDKRSFDKISKYIDEAKTSKVAKIIAGGKYDDSKGYFIEPTVILTEDPQFTTMCEEIFGPVVTIYVYKSEFDDVLKLVDETSPYALTGAVFARDRYAIDKATKALEHAAGNFYINDKPTGAVVGQQPFGGSRASGTNDKAGSAQNLHRWVSVRTIKETYVPAKNFTYPFMDEE
ncbi:MAG: L-glutamate gamma-semialdehyde dehydrogenase [Cytophagales bacterium]